MQAFLIASALVALARLLPPGRLALYELRMSLASECKELVQALNLRQLNGGSASAGSVESVLAGTRERQELNMTHAGTRAEHLYAKPLLACPAPTLALPPP